MKNSITIYLASIKGLFKNGIVFIVVLALLILPSLYAWVNIYAEWDPQANLKNLKIAIVNEDEGTTLQDQQINIGDEVVRNLKEHKELDWLFLSKELAEEAITQGDVYATIIISKTFSQDALSFLKKEYVHPVLEYTVNDKINGLTPYITEATSMVLQEMINQNFIKVIDEQIFQLFNTVGKDLSTMIPYLEEGKALILELHQELPTYINEVQTAYQDALFIQAELDQIQTMYDTLHPKVEALYTSVQGVLPKIEAISTYLEQHQTQIQKTISTFKQIIQAYPTTITEEKPYQEMLTMMQQVLTSEQRDHPQVQKVINQMEALKQDLQNPTLRTTLLQQLQDLTNSFDKSTLSNEIHTILQLLQQDAQKVQGEIQTLQGKFIQLQAFVTEGIQTLQQVQQQLQTTKQYLDSIIPYLEALPSEQQLEAYSQLLMNDPTVTAAYLSNPILLKTNTVFSIPNDGSAMAPFYSILSLWVGTLILMAMMKVKREGYTEKPAQMYLGQYLFFLTLVIIQAIVLATGDLYLLKVYHTNTLVYYLVCIYSGMVFMTIVYTLVTLFHNVGKALAIIYLIIQVAAGGGVFPVALTNSFFMSIAPYLPFQYAINALREPVAGITTANLVYNLQILTYFLVIFFILGITLKKPINRWMNWFTHKLEESDVLE